MGVKEEVLEVEEEDVEVEGILAFSFKRDNALSEIAVDFHMRVLELVVVAVSEEVQITVVLKEVVDHVSRLMVDNKVVQAVMANQWEEWGPTEVIHNREVHLVTVSQVALVVKERCQVLTVVRVRSQVVTAVRVRAIKVFTVIAVVMLRGRRVVTNSPWAVVDLTPPSLQELMDSLQDIHSKMAEHHWVVIPSNPVGILVAQRTGSK